METPRQIIEFAAWVYSKLLQRITSSSGERRKQQLIQGGGLRAITANDPGLGVLPFYPYILGDAHHKQVKVDVEKHILSIFRLKEAHRWPYEPSEVPPYPMNPNLGWLNLIPKRVEGEHQC